MLDSRIYTFLKLCDVMNYRITAEELNMTQPAVTQHIKFLENYYGCNFFKYSSRKLSKTPEGVLFEAYLRSADYNQATIKNKLSKKIKQAISIGATKTIGDYVITDNIIALLNSKDIDLSLYVDNTSNLLDALNHKKISLALIEGFFDKAHYEYKLLREEAFIGICAKNHPFAGKEVPIESLFDENLIIREEGSGTRAILEQILINNNHSLDSFKTTTCISSFEVIKKLVIYEAGISFVYNAVAKSDSKLMTFKIKNNHITREFNFVYLKNTDANKYISYFE